MKKALLHHLYQQVRRCNCQCPGERQGAGTVVDTGNPETGIVLLGEAPGGEEIKLGEPFVGRAGVNLEGYLRLAGLQRGDVFIINSVKCRPVKNGGRANRRPVSCEIRSCARWLDEELAILSPRVIIALGDVALKRFGDPVRRIGECHGEPLLVDGVTVIPMYHPAAVIYRRQLAEVIAADFINLGQWLKRSFS
ncbi:MAG: uracil-DNA glycosylase [Firmicutes bacterium]|nr:uracil-DNA glycosylase [Bacillota bacterium]